MYTNKLNLHEKINYVEFPSKDLDVTKKFFTSVFGWEFKDFGSNYTTFENQGINGGFYKSDLIVSSKKGSALIVFYSNQLEVTLDKIVKHGGTINKPIFSFPGGKRFHFSDKNGNEYGVWSNK